jgi:mRNA interferase RelE/StbE
MYKITIKRSAQKELQQISPPYNQKIIDAIDALAENPRPDGVKIKRRRSLSYSGGRLPDHLYHRRYSSNY